MEVDPPAVVDSAVTAVTAAAAAAAAAEAEAAADTGIVRRTMTGDCDKGALTDNAIETMINYVKAKKELWGTNRNLLNGFVDGEVTVDNLFENLIFIMKQKGFPGIKATDITTELYSCFTSQVADRDKMMVIYNRWVEGGHGAGQDSVANLAAANQTALRGWKSGPFEKTIGTASKGENSDIYLSTRAFFAFESDELSRAVAASQQAVGETAYTRRVKNIIPALVGKGSKKPKALLENLVTNAKNFFDGCVVLKKVSDQREIDYIKYMCSEMDGGTPKKIYEKFHSFKDIPLDADGNEPIVTKNGINFPLPDLRFGNSKGTNWLMLKDNNGWRVAGDFGLSGPNFTIFKSRCTNDDKGCWLSGKQIHFYLIYAPNATNKPRGCSGWFQLNGTCGEDEHVFTPGMGNILGTLELTGSKQAERMHEGGGGKNKISIWGLRPSRILENQIKESLNLIEPPTPAHGIQKKSERIKNLWSLIGIILCLSKQNRSVMTQLNQFTNYLTELTSKTTDDDKKTYLKGILEAQMNEKNFGEELLVPEIDQWSLTPWNPNIGTSHSLDMDNAVPEYRKEFYEEDKFSPDLAADKILEQIKDGENATSDYLDQFCLDWNTIGTPSAAARAAELRSPALPYTLFCIRTLWRSCRLFVDGNENYLAGWKEVDDNPSSYMVKPAPAAAAAPAAVAPGDGGMVGGTNFQVPENIMQDLFFPNAGDKEYNTPGDQLYTEFAAAAAAAEAAMAEENKLLKQDWERVAAAAEAAGRKDVAAAAAAAADDDDYYYDEEGDTVRAAAAAADGDYYYDGEVERTKKRMKPAEGMEMGGGGKRKREKEPWTPCSGSTYVENLFNGTDLSEDEEIMEASGKMVGAAEGSAGDGNVMDEGGGRKPRKKKHTKKQSKKRRAKTRKKRRKNITRKQLKKNKKRRKKTRCGAFKRSRR